MGEAKQGVWAHHSTSLVLGLTHRSDPAQKSAELNGCVASLDSRWPWASRGVYGHNLEAVFPRHPWVLQGDHSIA